MEVLRFYNLDPCVLKTRKSSLERYLGGGGEELNIALDIYLNQGR